MTLATPPFGKIFGVMSELSLGTRVSNLKSVALTVLELLAFNSHRSAAHGHTDRRVHTHTHISNEHIISAIHFVYMAEIITIVIIRMIMFMVLSSWQATSRVHLVHMISMARRQAAADPQHRPNDRSCESTCRLIVGCQKPLPHPCR